MRANIKIITIIVLLVMILSASPANSTVLLQRVHLKAVGDIMVHDVQFHSAYTWQTDNYDFMPMFEPVKDHLKADILIGNLETTLGGKGLGYSSYPRFNSPDNIAETLKKLGFDLLFTANNHCLDKGEHGLKRTLDILDKHNILHTGTFATNEDRNKSCIINAHGITFGFLNYTYGTNGLKAPKGKEYLVNYLELEKIKEDIERLRNQVEMLVVGLHFGNEYHREPSQEQRDIVKTIAEAGADIILGGHPHVLQPYEFIAVEDRQCFVVYSLGNFVSGQKKRYRDSGAILDLIIEKSLFDKHPKIVKIDFIPVWVRRYMFNQRLQMEVIPTELEIPLKKPLSKAEINKLAQVKHDVNEIWQPFENRYNLNHLLSIYSNNFFPIIEPTTWLPLIVKIGVRVY